MLGMSFNVVSGDAKKDKMSLDALDFSSFIGQDEVLSKVRFYLASHDSSSPFPTLLFTGSHGLGKTYMANLVADNMGRNFCELNASMVNGEKDFVEQFVMGHVAGTSPVTVLIDECHRLPKDVMTLLLTVLNPSDNKTVEIMYRNTRLSFDMRFLNFIFATTDAFRMVAPLKNRCQEVYFRAYRYEELMQMLLYYLESDESIIKCDKDALIRACRNRGRDTYVLATNVKRYWDVYGTNHVIEQSDMERLFGILGMDSFGLYRRETDLVKSIATHGPISACNLAMVLMVSEDNVKYELEVRPRELGLIQNTSKGRVVTNKGKEYLNV